MGIFVEYKTAIANNAGDVNLANTPVTIIEAVDQSIIVTDIDVCNIGNQPIRLNLQYQQTAGESGLPAVFRLKNILVDPNGSINLGQLLVNQSFPSISGNGIFLEGDPTTSTVSSLIFFTNGYSQICNCTIGYVLLLETPFGGFC
jgi:hypothetical protein